MITNFDGRDYKVYDSPISEELFDKFRHNDPQPEFTFNNPTYATAKWAQCDFTMASYMGYKLFLKNNEVGMLNKVRAMRIPCQQS